MAEKEPPGGDGPQYEAYRAEVPAVSPNGHGRRARRRRPGLRGVPAGVLVSGLVASSVVPRLLMLNLAFYNPWPRPVFAAGLGGIAAGVLRQGRMAAACLVGALTSVVGLWAVYAITRAQNHVLFVDRSVSKVVIADLARLAAYALPAGALGAGAGWWLRRGIDAVRRRRSQPITRLPRRAAG